jgi:hypothetical protein
MKPLIILILLALASIASAFPARFKWNKNPAGENIREYRLYQVVEGVKVLRLTHPATVGPETVERTVALEVETGETYVVTAYNDFESEPSDPKIIPVKPTKPGQLEIVLEGTEDAVKWIPIAKATVDIDVPVKLFRTRVTTIRQAE